MDTALAQKAAAETVVVAQTAVAAAETTVAVVETAVTVVAALVMEWTEAAGTRMNAVVREVMTSEGDGEGVK